MYRIEEKDNSESSTLKHSPEVFHEAIKDKKERYHVINENGKDYDIAYIKNDHMIPGKSKYLPNDLLPDYIDFDYNENDPDSIWLTLFDGYDRLAIKEINEYTVAIIKVALKYTDMEILTNDENVNLFFDDNERVKLVDEIPEYEDYHTFLVSDYGDSGYGSLDSVPNRMDPIYTFHNLFFLQWLTDGKPLKNYKYVKVLVPEHANIGAILIDLLKFKTAFDTIGLKIIDNEDFIGRFRRDMFDKLFNIGLYHPEAKEEEITVVKNLFSLIQLQFCNRYDFKLTSDIIQPEIKKEMDTYYNAVFDNNKVLGVIARGTDYTKLFNKTSSNRRMTLDKSLRDKVHEWFDKYHFDSIFLATEDIDILNEFKNEFGDKVIAVIQERYSVDDFDDEHTFDELEAKMNQEVEHEIVQEDTSLNYLYALYLISKCDSLISAGYCNGYEIAKRLNEGKFKNLFNFGVIPASNYEESDKKEPIKLSGRLDVANRDKISEHIKKNIKGENLITLDLTDVDYISTAGLSYIIELKDELNREIALTGVNEDIKEKLKMANLDKVFLLEESA